MGTQGEGVTLQTRKRALNRTQPCWPPDLGLPASRSVRKHISVVKSPSSSWYLVIPSDLILWSCGTSPLALAILLRSHTYSSAYIFISPKNHMAKPEVKGMGNYNSLRARNISENLCNAGLEWEVLRWFSCANGRQTDLMN